MRIAACDGKKDFLEMLKQTIYSYARQKRMEIVVDCYLCGENMLAAKQKYDIVFMGYLPVGKNGFQIARELRKHNSRSAIIFICPNTHLVMEAFKVNTFRFLVSPVKRSELFCVLDEYFEEYGNNYPVWIKSGVDTVCLNTEEIVYVEADNKHCYIHLEDESYKCNRTMAKVYDVLPKSHFFKINRAFVINADYVNKYNNEEVYLKNGHCLHISRNYLNDFKTNYRCLLEPLQP